MPVDLSLPPYRSAASPIKPTRMVCGTLLTKSIPNAKKFCEDMLGFECVVMEPGRMLARTREDLQPAGAIRRRWVFDVREAQELANPQRVLHHWGMDVNSKEAVNQMHDRLTTHKTEYGLATILAPSFQHGSYAFYFSDADSNWWEFQFVPQGQRHRALLDRGDVA